MKGGRTFFIIKFGQSIVEKNSCRFMSSMPFSDAPSRFCGLRLNNARNSDCASGLRLSGMPSFAFRIWFIVSGRVAQWNGKFPVSISNCKIFVCGYKVRKSKNILELP